VGALEGTHCAGRGRPEDAVGADAEPALQERDRAAAGLHARVAPRGPRGAAAVSRRAKGAPRGGPRDAVGVEAVAALETTDGARRSAAEATVGADVERALQGGHGATVIAALQCGGGVRGAGAEQRRRDGREQCRRAPAMGAWDHVFGWPTELADGLARVRYAARRRRFAPAAGRPAACGSPDPRNQGSGDSAQDGVDAIPAISCTLQDSLQRRALRRALQAWVRARRSGSSSGSPICSRSIRWGYVSGGAVWRPRRSSWASDSRSSAAGRRSSS